MTLLLSLEKEEQVCVALHGSGTYLASIIIYCHYYIRQTPLYRGLYILMMSPCMIMCILLEHKEEPGPSMFTN